MDQNWTRLRSVTEMHNPRSLQLESCLLFEEYRGTAWQRKVAPSLNSAAPSWQRKVAPSLNSTAPEIAINADG